MLNKMPRAHSNPKPFQEMDILLNPGEQRRILESPLGLINAFLYCARVETKNAIAQTVKSVVEGFQDTAQRWKSLADDSET